MSELSSIAGVGPARQRTLLEHFGSVRALRGASTDQITALPGFSAKLAGEIMRHLQGDA